MVNEYASVGGGGPSAGYSGAGGGSAGSSYVSNPTSMADAAAAAVTGSSNPHSVGSAEWWSAEISSREQAAAENTSDTPVASSSNGSSVSTYTDPRTGQTFATRAIAESLGYGPSLVAGERTDAYAKTVEQIGKEGGRAAQEAYIARHDDPLGTPLGISGAATTLTDVSQQYLNRPDIYPVTDPRQKALMESGYTQLGAAEELYSQSKTQSEQRYYETLMTQAITSRTGESAAYHTWAANTGVAQKANPYEYTADLMVYLQQGYPTKEKNVFSPVDYTVLGLKEGKGINDYIWGSKKYDIGNAVGIISAAEKSGEMGPYGKLSAFSSGYGVLPLELQQQIGAVAATSPENKEGWKVDLSTMWGAGLQTEKSTGTKVVTPEGVALGTGPEVMFTGLPKPFVSGKLIEPTGKIGIPFTDVAFTIPVVSNVLKYFEPTMFVSGRASEVKEVPIATPKAGGPDYTNLLISPETGKATRELTTKVGEPRTEMRVSPITGETETVTVQDYETFTLPKTRIVGSYKPTPLRSGYEQMLDENVRSKLPSVETGERALAMTQLANPFSTTESAPAIIGREIVFRGAGLVGIDTTAPRENVEFVKSWTSPTKGQYEFFYENPLTSAVSWGTMAVGGGATRGVVGALGKTERGAALIAKAAPIFTKYAGPVLGGLYGGMISYEETGGFRDITPQTAARVKSRAYQEGIPGAVGFGMGYYSPEIGTSVIRAGGSAVKAGGEKIFEMRQRSAGIERIEPGTITEYYDVMPSSPARPVEAPTRESLPWKPTKAEAMEYIKARYPEQGAIWEKYMTDVQMVPARKVPRPEEISTPKEAQAYLQSIQPKGVKVTSDMLAGERPRLKLEKVGEGTYRQTESGYIIPAGTTLTTGVGKPVSLKSLYYSSIIEPQVKGVREQTYGIPLEEQVAYKEASPKERSEMRREERESVRRAEKAYRGGSGVGGSPTGSVRSPARSRGGSDPMEFEFGVSSGAVDTGTGQALRLKSIGESVGAVWGGRKQTRMQAYEEEVEYMRSDESIKAATGLTKPSPSQSIASIQKPSSLAAQQPASFGLTKEAQAQTSVLSQARMQSVSVSPASRASTIQMFEKARKEMPRMESAREQIRMPISARVQARSIETARARATESARTTNIARDSAMGKITDQPLTLTTSTPIPTPLTRPTITTTPPSPFIPSLPSSSGGRGTTGQRFRSFRETLRIGEGVRWIDINGRKQTSYRAPVARSEPAKGKTSTASKRKRGLRF